VHRKHSRTLCVMIMFTLVCILCQIHMLMCWFCLCYIPCVGCFSLEIQVAPVDILQLWQDQMTSVELLFNKAESRLFIGPTKCLSINVELNFSGLRYTYVAICSVANSTCFHAWDMKVFLELHSLDTHMHT
jgi:hypothetical protein